MIDFFFTKLILETIFLTTVFDIILGVKATTCGETYENVNNIRKQSRLQKKVVYPRKHLENKYAQFSDDEVNQIYDFYEECIENGINVDGLNDPFKVFTMKQFKDLKNKLGKEIRKMKKKENQEPFKIKNKDLRKMNSDKYDAYIHMLDFERETGNLSMNECPCCFSRSLNDDSSTTKTSKLCSLCKSEKKFKIDKNSSLTSNEQRHQFLLKHEMLPVWYEENDLESKLVPQYHIPSELSDLTTVEILLIQRYSAYVPIFHMSKGHTGMKGHCVCFIQDTQEVCNELPRKSCSVVKIVKHIDDNGVSMTKNFSVNKNRVLKALKWLKIHHRYYKDIEIKEENLSWMNGINECEMSVETITQTQFQNQRDNSQEKSTRNSDTTVSGTQTHVTDFQETEIEGTANNMLDPSFCAADKEIFDSLNEEANNSQSDLSFMKFPEISEEAVCEYSEDVLPNIFPHLYPGGIGGCNNHHISTNEQSLHKYAKRLLNYKDGRFCGDSIWAYYMLDMIQRSKNNKNGNFIIKDGALGSICESVADLKEKIKNGDLTWIELLRNYSKRIRGSDNYWRSKRSEVESWINYHVEHKHGPPTLFITLSCAENWWKDLHKLLKKKLHGTKYEFLISQLESDDEKTRLKARCKVSQTFSITVQEFFQKRVEIWLEKVGKPVFGIKYYWGRFEFAKGRGQIHLHLLGIVENRKVQHQYYECVLREDLKSGIQLLSKYAREELGLTAEHPAYDVHSDLVDSSMVSSLKRKRRFTNIFINLRFSNKYGSFIKNEHLQKYL